MNVKVHENLHDGSGLAKTLKRIGQYYYEKTHTREEFMAHTHKNYLTTPLSQEEKDKYGIDVECLDLTSDNILNLLEESYDKTREIRS